MKVVDRAPTGILGLDDLIQGGLPRSSSLIIRGPSYSGKTIFSMQIQYASMKRGEPCLFIAYRRLYSTVIKIFLSFGWDIYKYMEQGNFKIFDNVCAISKLNLGEVRNSLNEVENKGIVFVPDPYDEEAYFNLQIEVMEKIGMGGINVIDSVDYRFRFMKKGRIKAPEDILRYFQRFRDRLAREGHIGLHLYAPIVGEEKYSGMLDEIEQGGFEFKLEEKEGEQKRYMRILGLPFTHHDTRWHPFKIDTKRGIELIG